MTKQKPAGKPKLQLVVVALIVACPILLVGAILQKSKAVVDVFDEQHTLEARMAEAKKEGFLFESKDFQPVDVSPAENGYLPLKEYFLDTRVNPNSKEFDELTARKLIFEKELPEPITNTIVIAHEVGQHTKFDAKRDYDLGYWLLLPEFRWMRISVSALCYEAIRLAHHGHYDEAKQSLEHAQNISSQISEDPTFIGRLAHIRLLQVIYDGIAQSVIASPNPEQCDNVLKSLWEAPPKVQPIAASLRFELFSMLSVLRNYEQLGGLKTVEVLVESGEGEPINSEKMVRTGLPTSAVARGMFSKSVAICLELNKIAKSNRPLVEIGTEMDRVVDSQKKSYASLFSSIVFPVYQQAAVAELRPMLNRELGKWAVSIWLKSKSVPNSVPSKIDPAFGGSLVYRKFNGGFCLYSTGPNKRDDGGPSIVQTIKGAKTDDMGMIFPFGARTARLPATQR